MIINLINKKKVRLFALGFMLTSFISFTHGQIRTEKTIAIIKKMKLIKAHKNSFRFSLEQLKDYAIGSDSVRIIEIEKQLTEENIAKRIAKVFDKAFSEKEINIIYDFFRSNVFEKLSPSGEIDRAILFQFMDVNEEISKIVNSKNDDIERLLKDFKLLSGNRVNGFYEIVEHISSTIDENLKLEKKPSLTRKDFLEVKPDYNNNEPEIRIVLTKDGARKLQLLTKKNIGKPIAIVIRNRVVSSPTVTSEIQEGMFSITGGFSEKLIGLIIKELEE